MALQYGDTVRFNDTGNNLFKINGITDVAPIRFDTIIEEWMVCGQHIATHMLVAMDTNDGARYALIEIGKCKDIYLLADAIVD